MSEHTPTPWAARGKQVLEEVSGHTMSIAYLQTVSGAGIRKGKVESFHISDQEAAANAALIVEAVNNHEALKAENESLRSELEQAEAALSDTLNMLRAAHMQCGVHHDSNKRVIKARETLDQCRSLMFSSTKCQGGE